MGWYIVGAGLIVIGVLGVAVHGGMAAVNQSTQRNMWGRTFSSSEGARRYNSAKNTTVGVIAICAGIAVLVVHAVTH